MYDVAIIDNIKEFDFAIRTTLELDSGKWMAKKDVDSWWLPIALYCIEENVYLLDDGPIASLWLERKKTRLEMSWEAIPLKAKTLFKFKKIDFN
jgi:hypothetical protein